MDLVHRVAEYLSTFIGAVTLTGSAIAFGKLHGNISSKALALPAKNLVNIALLGGSILAGFNFVNAASAAAGLTALIQTTVLAGILGAHMTASIGGAGVLLAGLTPLCGRFRLTECPASFPLFVP